MDFAIVQIPGESVHPFRSNPHSNSDVFVHQANVVPVTSTTLCS